jgi:hypothetical protein
MAENHRVEEKVARAEKIRGNLAGIILGGWILAINEANPVFSNQENSREQRAKAALIMLVAAEDIAFRSKESRQTEIEQGLTGIIYDWTDRHQQEIPGEILNEVKMEKIKHDLRNATLEGREQIIAGIKDEEENTQKAVLMARAARIIQDEKLMEEAIEIQRKFNNPDRLAVLLRWQKELKNPSAMTEYRETVLKIVYGEIFGRIPWTRLVPNEIAND